MATIRMNDPADLEDMNPIESQQFPGFYEFPLDRKILVSRDGEIRNAKSGNLIQGFVNETGTRTISKWDDGKVRTHATHRIVARTFVGRPTRHLDKPYDDLMVNHIDRNRGNNHAGNLEWVTGTENCLHYHLTGSNVSRVVLAKSTASGEVIRHYSVRSCADYHQIHRATLNKHLIHGKPGTREMNGFVFKFEDEGEWPPIDRLSVKKFGESHVPNAVVVTWGKVRTEVFTTIKSAAAALGVKYLKLYKILRKLGKYSEDGVTAEVLINGGKLFDDASGLFSESK